MSSANVFALNQSVVGRRTLRSKARNASTHDGGRVSCIAASVQFAVFFSIDWSQHIMSPLRYINGFSMHEGCMSSKAKPQSVCNTFAMHGDFDSSLSTGVLAVVAGHSARWITFADSSVTLSSDGVSSYSWLSTYRIDFHWPLWKHVSREAIKKQYERRPVLTNGAPIL